MAFDGGVVRGTQAGRPMIARHDTFESLTTPPAHSKQMEIARAVARLDVWLETMRGPHGYGGPVVHWWQQSMVYTGPGLDWRYEGIIAGYLALWRASGDARWLSRACRAGDDLIAGHLPDGHFRASAFEINPAPGGTPHEAACDVGLLMLAQALRTENDDRWNVYASHAARNLRMFYIQQLWDDHFGAFRDHPRAATFVPNKAATVCDALCLLADLTDHEQLIDRYVLPTLDAIVHHQVRGGRLDGAIAQNSFGTQQVAKYFPIYIARCIPALVRGHRQTQHQSLLDAAMRAMQFIHRWCGPDGALPTVVYNNERTSDGPMWVAPLGDVLRAAAELRPYGYQGADEPILTRLLAGQDVTGGIQTATGFGAQAGGSLSSTPDLRDVIHVVGWCDKAFRYLAANCGPSLPEASCLHFEANVSFRGRPMLFCESQTAIDIHSSGEIRYSWQKGSDWPSIVREEFWRP